MARSSLIFLFASIFSFIFFHQSKGNSNCGVLIKSPCTDQVVSKWNKHNVAHQLKSWVTQIKKLTSLKQTEVKHFFSRKKVLLDPKTNIVRYIANVDCLSKTTFGPIWKTAGITSNHQFHDGFLYGHEDEKGTLTGTCVNLRRREMRSCTKLLSKWSCILNVKLAGNVVL